MGKCVFKDIVNEVAEKFKEADGIVIGSPVYYASPNGTLLSFLDRLFYSTPFDKSMKVGAAVAVARRSGTTATFDVLNKYFSISTCRLFHHNIGTTYMAGCQVKLCKMPKVCRPCVNWLETWRSW